jgi:hypothetical protein
MSRRLSAHRLARRDKGRSRYTQQVCMTLESPPIRRSPRHISRFQALVLEMERPTGRYALYA